MAVVVPRRRRRRRVVTVGERARRWLHALMILAVGTMFLGAAALFANTITSQGFLKFNITLPGQSKPITVDLGIIPPLILGFGGLFMYIRVLRDLIGVRL